MALLYTYRRRYIVIYDVHAWNRDATTKEHRAACARATAWCMAHDRTETFSVYVNPAHGGQGTGVYEQTRDADRLLPCDAIPTHVVAFIHNAYVHACETWPKDET